MTTNIQTNRLKQQAGDQKLIDGITKHASTIGTLLIGGQTMKAADIIVILQGRLAASNAAQLTRAAWRAAVKADLDERTKTKAFVSGVRQAIGVAFASSIDTLADFGLAPRKKAVVSPEMKVLASAKARATRAARHTAGKKQKAAIKGTVPPTVSASPPTPGSPSASVPSTGLATGTPATGRVTVAVPVGGEPAPASLSVGASRGPSAVAVGAASAPASLSATT